MKTFFIAITLILYEKKGKIFGEDLSFRDYTNPMRKKREIFRPFFRKHTILLEIFCFEHSGRFFPSLQTVLLSYGYDGDPTDKA